METLEITEDNQKKRKNEKKIRVEIALSLQFVTINFTVFLLQVFTLAHAFMSPEFLHHFDFW